MFFSNSLRSPEALLPERKGHMINASQHFPRVHSAHSDWSRIFKIFLFASRGIGWRIDYISSNPILNEAPSFFFHFLKTSKREKVTHRKCFGSLYVAGA